MPKKSKKPEDSEKEKVEGKQTGKHTICLSGVIFLHQEHFTGKEFPNLVIGFK